MSDYVSREAAVKEIDEWIMAFDDNVHKQSQADARLIRKGIANLPAADVVEVVRCKDCKYWDDTEAEPLCEILCDGDVVMFSTEPEYFCCYGERRQE